MRISYTERFLTEVANLPKERGLAAIDAFAKFAADPSDHPLAFAPLDSRPAYFTIRSRKNDILVFRQEEDDLFIAVDVGAFARIYEVWGR